MSEIEKNEPIFMETDEYLEYLNNQMKRVPDADKHPIAQITMYQMNKDLIKTLKRMNNMAINEALDKVRDWYIKYIYSHPTSTYFALLNHEQHYFTIFARDSKKKLKPMPSEANDFIATIKDILMNYYGDNDIRSIDVDENGAIEIWGMWNGEPSVAYLFPYDEGVVLY